MTKKRPSISVVIPTYNGQALLAKHLPDVIAQLIEGDEIVIVDDASPDTDRTLEWLADFAMASAPSGVELQLIKHPKNQRFAAAVNTGVQAAKHQWIWLLNNDVSPITEDSVEKLLSWFSSDPTLFAVGCAEVTSRGPDAKVAGRGTGHFQRGLLVHWYDPDQTQNKTLWTTGGSMFFEKAKFEDIGGMDTLFAPAYEEDRDLSYRALKRGWHILFDPSVVVLHQHETTNASVFGNRGIANASWKNQFQLVWKNISSPSLLLSHFFWLPYHLVVSNFREGGAVGRGLWQALRQLPSLLEKRALEKPHWQRTDQEILLAYGSRPPQSL